MATILAHLHTEMVLGVIIKFLRNSYPSFSELVQFRNQYAITKNLNSTGIVQPLSLERYGNGYALVMPEEGAISLDKAIEKNESLDLRSCLEIGIQLADILQELDRNRVIHKDIKPSNILILPETRQVKLIDFSIASLLPREEQEIKNFNVLEGTLAYISPEQTGRMNRGIDYRSDFYSLGATLYELLTGSLPFSSSDPMELVHCHISQQPRNPVSQRNRVSEIPQVVSDIVMKLMAKNAEERYQSALGLKFDLENCLNQWLETGKIEAFELATRDIAGRFNIPEKLYGREAEVKTLLAAFDRVAQGSRETLLVAGFSGIGKTAVVNEVHKPIVKNRGYFIQGKFDQLNRNIPFSAFVPAFRSLMGQLLGESDANLEKWKTKILEALGNSGQVLIEVIPELENVIGKQPPVPELSGSAAQNRFNLLFQKFIAVFTTAEHPLAIFLDDLQWADLASLQLFELLMQDNRYLLILGAYRDNEVSPTHPLMQTIASLRKDNAVLNPVVNTIRLNPLKFEDTNRLITETLNCTHKLAEPLTELVDRKTQGNPFFTTQFLKSLHGEGYIEFDHNQRYWQCDLAQVRQLALTDDVVKFMMLQLQKLSAPTQNVLKLAACIGNQFDLQTLAIVSERSLAEAAADLWKALQEGFILPTSQVYKFFQGNEETSTEANPTYRFLHDRVQQAAYALIPDNQKQVTHWKIGQLLLQKLSSAQQSNQIFDLVNQLNLGSTMATKLSHKYQLAQLNLQAGQKAKLAAAYQSARDYCVFGINLLPNDAWETDYSLTYGLYREASESAYLCSNFERAEALYGTALTHAQTDLDKAVVYRIQMTQYQLQGRNAEAIAIQRKSLKLLGWDVPIKEESIQACLDRQIVRVNQFLEKEAIESILDFPKMVDREIEEILRILQILFYAAWLDGQPTLALLALAKMTTLSLDNGNSDMSPFGYVGYGLIGNALLKNAAQAYQFGEMAVRLCEQFDNADVRGMTNFLFAADVHSWRQPLRAADAYYENAFKYGMEAGNWLTVGFMMMLSGSDRLTYGKNLEELHETAQIHADFLRQIKSLDNLNALIVGVLQPVRQLLGLTHTSTSFDDRDFSEIDYLKQYQNAPYHLAWFYSVKIRHAYLFEQEMTYLDLIPQLNLIKQAIPSHAKVPSTTFYVVLMYLALIQSSDDLAEQQSYWQELLGLEELLNDWAEDCAENIHHKCLLINAEKARLSGDRSGAIELYDRAIAKAKENGYIHEEALGNELAAKFYLQWGKEKIAQTYMTDAYYGYARWGAKAKTDDLESRYGDLLGPMQNSQATITDPQLRTSLSHNTRFDLASAIEAARAISGEIKLQKLLSTLMRVSLENAGAQKGAFILPGEDGLTVAVQAFRPHPEAELEIRVSDSFAPIDSNPNLPRQLIQYAARTGKTLVLDRAATDRQFAADPYLSDRQPQSILCAPIRVAGTSLPDIIEEDRDRFVGLLYLENTLAAGAFTRDRLELLELLSAQAAISIENARLYDRLEEYSHTLEAQVESRTEHLQSTLQQLQRAQLQLIQTEKMSSLGQMVAGIAHEINNPISFISGNITYSREHFHTLLELLEFYQRELPHPSAALEEKLEESELDFVKSDMEKMLESMERGSDRISNIILGLRNFSRLDEAEYKEVDIHEGLDNTVLILQHRLKSHKPEIAIVKKYAELPHIQCYANQLNQVFLNILSNAIDAFMSETGQHPQIAIATEMKNPQTVRISIGDNGPGMSENLCQKIFDPFFTTKPVGQGTGLGLSTSYQIITEQHQGQLHCISQPGEGAEFIIEIPV